MSEQEEPLWWPQPPLDVNQRPEKWLTLVLDRYAEFAKELREGKRPRGWSKYRTSSAAAELEGLLTTARGFRFSLERKCSLGIQPGSPAFDDLVDELACAALVGMNIAMVAAEKAFEVGFRVSSGGKMGVRGKLDRDECQSWLDREHERDPSATWADLRRRAARKFLCDERTIRNQCHAPSGVRRRSPLTRRSP